MPYLTTAQFKLRTKAPSSAVSEIEQIEPGWVDAQLEMEGAWINARLAKRYAVPFADPAPPLVLSWLTRIVTASVWLRRGRDPLDEGTKAYEDDAAAAKAEVLEAAEAENGLFELPLKPDGSGGVVYGSSRVYSEASPYAFSDVQGNVGRAEDYSRSGGTFG